MNTVSALTARASTSGGLYWFHARVGFHGKASPVAKSTAATAIRGWPPADVNFPPIYTVEPSIAIARTAVIELAAPICASQAVTAPVIPSSAATAVRLAPPIVRNVPPTKTVVPETTSELMAGMPWPSSGLGSHGVNPPLVVSTAARELRHCPLTVRK